MVGKDCVAIACDLRLGNQALTVACNFEKVIIQAHSVGTSVVNLQALTNTCFSLLHIALNHTVIIG